MKRNSVYEEHRRCILIKELANAYFPLIQVKRQGFKSVAHYLIGTRMEHKIEDPTPEDGLQVSADGESKPIDGLPSQSDQNSVLQISDDNKHGGMDEDYNATNYDSHDSSGDESEDS